MKRFALTVLAALPIVCAAQSTPINDSNTPLHLMKPEYKTAYSIPTTSEVKNKLDCVLHLLEQSTPMVVEDNTSLKPVNSFKNIDENSRLRRGAFRLTSYEWGVTYSAMLAAGEVCGDKAYTDYAVKRMEFLAEVAPHFERIVKKNRDTDPLMLKVIHPAALDDAGAICSAMTKADIGGLTTKLGSQIDLYADYVINKQQRLPDGNFARNRPQKNTVWLDDMFMGLPTEAGYALVLEKRGKKDEAQALQERAAKDFLVFSDRMWVSQAGLYRHGWVEAMELHPAFFWARANGWALLTACELLDQLPTTTTGYYEIKHRFQMHLEALASLQGFNGFWHQLLDRPDTYEETSATAIYAYCMAHAINRGWIDAMTYGPRVLLAWNAVASQVTDKGEVLGTCVGTGMGFDAAFYAYRPVHSMAAHGYGPVIWAGAEVIRLLQTQHPKSNDSAIHFYPSEVKNSEPIFEVE